MLRVRPSAKKKVSEKKVSELHRDERCEAESEVLVLLRSATECPPGQRVILFTPEFGSTLSYDAEVWKKLAPEDDCEVWVCSWQGWANFGEMMKRVCPRLESFADPVSTVWFGHSTGALVAYEVFRQLHALGAERLPVALVVSGCPAPFLFSKEFKPVEKYPWLTRFKYSCDFDDLELEELEVLEQQFQMVFDVRPSFAQGKCFVGDLRMIKTYKHQHQDVKVGVPILAICHAKDPLVSEASVSSWSACSADGFEIMNLSSSSDSRAAEGMGHGYAWQPVMEFINAINSWTLKHRRPVNPVPSCDIGPIYGDLPEKCDVFVIGASIQGVHECTRCFEQGQKVICVDAYKLLGGKQDKPLPQNVLRDVYRVAEKAHGCYWLRKKVLQVDTEQDGSYLVRTTCVDSGKISLTSCKSVVSFASQHASFQNQQPRLCDAQRMLDTDTQSARADIILNDAAWADEDEDSSGFSKADNLPDKQEDSRAIMIHRDIRSLPVFERVLKVKHKFPKVAAACVVLAAPTAPLCQTTLERQMRAAF